MTKAHYGPMRSLFLHGSNDHPGMSGAADAFVIAETQLVDSYAARFSSVLDRLFVMVDHRDTDQLAETLARVVEIGAAGVILLSPCRPQDVQKADALLSVAEATQGKALDRTGIIAMAGESAGSVLNAERMAGQSDRLLALGGSGNQLARSLNIERSAVPVAIARGLVVLYAASAGVRAIADADHGLAGIAFETACHADRADGYCGKFVTSPEQVEIANLIFGLG